MGKTLTSPGTRGVNDVMTDRPTSLRTREANMSTTQSTETEYEVEVVETTPYLTNEARA